MIPKQFNILKNQGTETENFHGDDIYVENLKNILKEKEEKVIQLFGLIKSKGDNNIDNNEQYEGEININLDNYSDDDLKDVIITGEFDDFEKLFNFNFG